MNELLEQWRSKGKFTHNGVTYIQGINDDSALRVLIPESKKVTGMICHLPSELTLTNCDLDERYHYGFTIGKGKKFYWMMIWHQSGHVTVYGRDDESRRWISGDTEVTVHFK